ncbi:phosphatidate cytidylyltransferase [Aquabacterium sp. OR-4]|uniref:phosphatidate cytidylyltransferase n=1 Tax=Aquabacterium sp. OR-4 TaxID=2978127 RepID=UPI0021B32A7E|nr:phosphatidate cytidylyltransferase [Aquabacterium sp. OR-4]MDT7835457.1 phosphatidate cytidylyltransferase [Aquabacterium sp. OR-4]
MLRQRVITALVLLGVLLPALFAPMAWPFAALSLLLIGAAGWEWSRLNGRAGAVAVATGLAVVAVSVILGLDKALPEQRGLWWPATLAWVVAGGLALRAGPQGWPRLPLALRWLIGVALLAVGWNAIAAARVIGINFLLSAMALVWMADIAAYFGGRAFGRRKLAPGISPGKSWEGVFSGWVGVLLLAWLWVWVDRHHALGSASLYTQLLGTFGWWALVLGCLGLAGLSVVGDLFESLVKRACGAKDSSGLLPGHGGVLDRIDALLPVLPAAMALISL